MHLIPIALATLLATAEAILITKPATDDSVDVAKDWQVCWTAVNTDPQQFCLYLTNFNEYPSQIFNLLDRQPVETNGGGCVTIPGKCYSGLRTTSSYRVRAASCSDPSTIYAESGDFSASQSTCAAATLRRDVRKE
ncbi:uncharacterized protein BP01DRAFT_408891 [Aspergillus saccharolyticus JOP 1030-1]|uniref:Yeast cell wall synthesis Kre9/Knh1-like N-terminal domain-containing protein n=1 Tax=Aspergillus saccharolyticus JOP 1030-1 TaxID=1450539 RepID=A0A318Z1M8_9EURO|nr:hypothetical protein BP01DRAFT_408891 [Aspergillus saccharolyticus JOP 1030-1]PYH40819.1 hypothetical protein BP01DRAFT_408891 [Aspergillus saccharolyticus JOP 1030-1]